VLKHEIDWKGGTVRYWYLDIIDLTKPLQDQNLDLDEDMGQVHYPNGVILGVAWYNTLQAFKVVVVENGNPWGWQEPLFKRVSSCDLPAVVREAVEFVELYSSAP
jgi:hypothetical protein